MSGACVHVCNSTPDIGLGVAVAMVASVNGFVQVLDAENSFGC